MSDTAVVLRLLRAARARRATKARDGKSNKEKSRASRSVSIWPETAQQDCTLSKKQDLIDLPRLAQTIVVRLQWTVRAARLLLQCPPLVSLTCSLLPFDAKPFSGSLE